MKYSETMIPCVCPICKCTRGKLLWTVSAIDAASHFSFSKKISLRDEKLVSHIARLWRSNSCDIIRCCSCGFTFSFPYVAGDKNFYHLAYERIDYPTWKWEFQVAFDVISRNAKEQPRILEIGAGDGAFISRLVSSVTSPKNIVAIEYSEYGRQKIESFGVRCFSQDIRTLVDNQLGEKFDYICLFQVLEHLDEVDDLLKTLHSLLEDSGEILIAVPNEKMIEFNELNDALLDMPPYHIGRWTEEAFQCVAKNNNFFISEHKYEPVNVVSGMKQFMQYRLLKRAQEVDTLTYNIFFKENGLVRRIGLGLMALLDTIVNARKLFWWARSIKQLGGISQFVRLKKYGSNA